MGMEIQGTAESNLSNIVEEHCQCRSQRPLTLRLYLQGGGSWLFPLQNGAPPIGWHDASAYLILPVLLVVSQYVSQKIISPPSSDPSQQSTQWILKFLPLMIGQSFVVPLSFISASLYPECSSLEV